MGSIAIIYADAVPLRLSDEELALRRERMAGFLVAWRDDPRHREIGQVMDERRTLSPPALELLGRFLNADADNSVFREGIDSWARGKPVFGFGGPAGSMFLNQLVYDGTDVGSEPLLRRLLRPPADVAEAVARIDELASFVQELRASGSAAAVGRCPFFLTWFWSLQEPEWRPMWPSADSALQKLAWTEASPETQGQRFEEYDSHLRGLLDDVLQTEEVLSWLGTNDLPVGFDTTLPKRCARAHVLPRDMPGEGAARDDVVGYRENLQNIRSGLAEMNRLGKRLAGLVAEELGHPVTASVPTEYWVPRVRRLRKDLWLSWRPQLDLPILGLRIQCTRDGVYFLINPEVNRNPKGFSTQALKLVTETMPREWMDFRPGIGEDLDRLLPQQANNRKTNFNVGYQAAIDRISSIADLEQAVRQFAKEAKPIIQRFVDGGVVTSPEKAEPKGDLAGLAAKFRSDTGYPTDADREHARDREALAHLLAKDRLPSLTKDVIRRVVANRYGSPGLQVTLNATVRDADDAEWERFLTSIDTLLWGDQSVEDRINRVLDESDLGFRGLKETIVMKLLAITAPERFVPVYPFSGQHGKAAMLQRLAAPVPSLQLSPGERHVQANDTLRGLLEPYFPGDAWGQGQFLYWFLEASEDEDDAEGDGEDSTEQRLNDAAKRLYLDRSFLDDIVGLLQDKGQVIFYGPPGTGKTFIAQVLAEALAPEPERRLLVQFHPSTTYEDFFEGYRPEPTEGGGLTYRLTPGPLRNLAEAAEEDPARTYLLIIDEINRSNLPKVLGELLYLLEYRNQAVRVLYRPEFEFSLPPNMWIIGTMNTADRSIALLDAALRRRFHFVPFIPDLAGKSPISQVLRRWVEANGELETLPDMVDRVNNQLRVALGGDHLLLGPSYFMQTGIDRATLRRVWEYQIEPLIEDLFFGEPARVDAFRFERVWAELGAPAEQAAADALSVVSTDVSGISDRALEE